MDYSQTLIIWHPIVWQTPMPSILWFIGNYNRGLEECTMRINIPSNTWLTIQMSITKDRNLVSVQDEVYTCCPTQIKLMTRPWPLSESPGPLISKDRHRWWKSPLHSTYHNRLGKLRKRVFAKQTQHKTHGLFRRRDSAQVHNFGTRTTHSRPF